MRITLLLWPFLLTTLFWGCSSEEKLDTSTAQGSYEWAQQLEEDERYEEAVIQYRDVKNKHPYSRFAVKSELNIANIHFKREAYIESQHAYQTFKEFHPKHKEIAFVTFRLAKSYYLQLPTTVDRDLTQARNAILYFDEVITSFPNSKLVNESIELKRKTLELLAGKIYYIAEFYFIREHWLSARQRFENLLKKYPGLGFDARALYGASISANHLGDKNLADKYFNILQEKHASSAEFKKARKELGK